MLIAKRQPKKLTLKKKEILIVPKRTNSRENIKEIDTTTHKKM